MSGLQARDFHAQRLGEVVGRAVIPVRKQLGKTAEGIRNMLSGEREKSGLQLAKIRVEGSPLADR